MSADPIRVLRERLSVVLLCHNCGHRLAPILDRLGRLGVPVVAVDNASRDDTGAVLAGHPDVEVVTLPVNVGAAGRNAGVDLVRTPYVAFCDDDGWYAPDGLDHAADLLDRHPRLALINARILVREEGRLDPISVEMAASPLDHGDEIPGAVLLSFMAGAAVMRVSAYRQAGGYDPRFFLGGEEETLAFPLARLGWEMRYVPDVVMHHHPSLANASRLRHFGMRNTLWNAWLHRRPVSALRWTAFVLADTPKNRDWVRGVTLALRGLPWVLRARAPLPSRLDAELTELDRRRFAGRRHLLTRRELIGTAAPVPLPDATAR